MTLIHVQIKLGPSNDIFNEEINTTVLIICRSVKKIEPIDKHISREFYSQRFFFPQTSDQIFTFGMHFYLMAAVLHISHTK